MHNLLSTGSSQRERQSAEPNNHFHSLYLAGSCSFNLQKRWTSALLLVPDNRIRANPLVWVGKTSLSQVGRSSARILQEWFIFHEVSFKRSTWGTWCWWLRVAGEKLGWNSSDTEIYNLNGYNINMWSTGLKGCRCWLLGKWWHLLIVTFIDCNIYWQIIKWPLSPWRFNTNCMQNTHHQQIIL